MNWEHNGAQDLCQSGERMLAWYPANRTYCGGKQIKVYRQVTVDGAEKAGEGEANKFKKKDAIMMVVTVVQRTKGPACQTA